ncbi:hypothetical protein LTR43_012168 [Exophiala xenobiotica]|nr:hypothetical protein LTR14_011937 [Exophiala xenobiotica]
MATLSVRCENRGTDLEQPKRKMEAATKFPANAVILTRLMREMTFMKIKNGCVTRKNDSVLDVHLSSLWLKTGRPNFAPVCDLDQVHANDKRRPALFTGVTNAEHPLIYILNPSPEESIPEWS